MQNNSCTGLGVSLGVVSIYRTSLFPKLGMALSTIRYVVSISTALSGVQGQG